MAVRKPSTPPINYVVGTSKNDFSDAARNAAKKVGKFGRSPIVLRVVDLQVVVTNPITEYRVILGPGD